MAPIQPSVQRPPRPHPGRAVGLVPSPPKPKDPRIDQRELEALIACGLARESIITDIRSLSRLEPEKRAAFLLGRGFTTATLNDGSTQYQLTREPGMLGLYGLGQWVQLSPPSEPPGTLLL